MEPQKIPNSQSNLEKEEQNWKYHAPWLQAILQSYINQSSMVLAQKQTYRSMEWNRELIQLSYSVPRAEEAKESPSCVLTIENVNPFSMLLSSLSTSHNLLKNQFAFSSPNEDTVASWSNHSFVCLFV